MIETSYGFKINSDSKYCIIAPHGAGDDINTDLLARKIAENLGASLVVNNRFLKYTNSLAKIKTGYIEDFNRLPWDFNSSKYDWKNKKTEMKEFYDDIENITLTNQDMIQIHIHGMKDNENSHIDIGTGAFYDFKLIPNSRLNRIIGKEKLDKEIARKLKDNLIDRCINTTINSIFTGCFRSFGIQFSNVGCSFQFEICYELRKSENIENTGLILSDSISLTFN